ncbi:DUF1707 and DUF4870 domain-containing protein [Embleya sp. NBC_00896]|uniref:DUF1707 and DUF4870 domain-containing protein n=1 Tax=Embleya sp. NBC_00896 TaxID=2975961 RepID=UPI00386F164A|nr:DUF1707 and DUF4870 domain-containing protein [Embleya sp. NBC_00896]
MRVGDADRERTIEHLKYAYGEGRLNADEFEERVASALKGRTRADLEALLDDLLMPMPGPPPLPMPRGMVGPPMPPPWWINRPVVGRRSPGESPAHERGWSAAAHWSGFCAPVLGPFVIRRTVGRRSQFVRDNARAALNYQLTCVLSFVIAPILALMGDEVGGLLIGAMYATIAVFALIGGARAIGGDVMRYPVSLRMVK